MYHGFTETVSLIGFTHGQLLIVIATHSLSKWTVGGKTSDGLVGYMLTTLRKKRVPKQYPWGTIATNSTLFLEGHSFFLNNHVYPKKGAPKQKGTIFQKSALGVLFCKKRFETVPFLKERVLFRYPFSGRVLFRSKKRSKTVPLWRGVPF